MERKEWIDQIFQVVMVVEDLDQMLDHWKQLVEFDVSSIQVYETEENAPCTYQGKEATCPAKYAVFDLGGVQMKLVQPLGTEGPYAAFLQKSGPGIHHVGVYSSEGEALLEKYAAAGIHPVFENFSGGEDVRLFDFTEETGLRIAVCRRMEGPCAR